MWNYSCFKFALNKFTRKFMVLLSVASAKRALMVFPFRLRIVCVAFLHERVVSCHVVSLGVSGSVSRFPLCFAFSCFVFGVVAGPRHAMQFTISSFWTMRFMLHDVSRAEADTMLCWPRWTRNYRSADTSFRLLLLRRDTEVQMKMGVFAERSKNTATVNAALSQSHKHNEKS